MDKRIKLQMPCGHCWENIPRLKIQQNAQSSNQPIGFKTEDTGPGRGEEEKERLVSSRISSTSGRW